MSGENGKPQLIVEGVVARDDGQPYIRLCGPKGPIALMSVGQARQIARDILVQCSRAEADAMIIKFFGKMEYPEGAAHAILNEFRDFRAGLDDEEIEHGHRIPPSEEGS